MGIFAHHPSPFQISYPELVGTSGASFMEYMIVDKAVPAKEAKYYSEKLICIPKTKDFVKNLENNYIEIVTSKRLK